MKYYQADRSSLWRVVKMESQTVKIDSDDKDAIIAEAIKQGNWEYPEYEIDEWMRLEDGF